MENSHPQLHWSCTAASMPEGGSVVTQEEEVVALNVRESKEEKNVKQNEVN